MAAQRNFVRLGDREKIQPSNWGGGENGERNVIPMRKLRQHAVKILPALNGNPAAFVTSASTEAPPLYGFVGHGAGSRLPAQQCRAPQEKGFERHFSNQNEIKKT